MRLTQLPPLSLYIHTPWCVQKCPYCDFNSHQLKSEIPESAYIDRLLKDLEQEMPSVWGRRLHSIFIGGGTPSLFSPESYDRLLSGIRSLLPFTSDTEITMEANPGTVEADKFRGFFEAGINRISIGVQSFDNRFLEKLGRIHNGDEAQAAFRIARDAGFRQINLDLMYALPGQSLTEAIDDLRIAIELAPEHLSWYQLTLEPNTLFYQQPPRLPEDDAIADMAEAGIQFLAENNFQRYEVSAYSRGGENPSQHNLNYWQFGDYLGIGAGAHGKISRMDDNTITRRSKRRSPKDYLNPEKSLIAESRELAAQEMPLEFMMNAMRLKQGIAAESFPATTGLLPGDIQAALVAAREKTLLTADDKQIQATPLGYQFLNEILKEFMPENFPHLANQQNISIRQLD